MVFVPLVLVPCLKYKNRHATEYSVTEAVIEFSYCGLCSAQRESAGKERRGPISKKSNKHLQTMLIESAKLAPGRNFQLTELHEKELSKGNRNRATLAVARKLGEYLLAVDRREAGFETTGLTA